jgi:heat-inducible transcriptional repressor
MTKPKTTALLNDRSQHLLKVLVQRYIREGLPVGSKSLLEESGLAVSPATIRNIMADLEDRGLIESPHTSAGRIPTSQGYRLFVDSLVTGGPVDEVMIKSLQAELQEDKSPKELVSSASQFLSEITRQAGLVSVPRHNETLLRQIEFLPLSGDRVLVIMVLNDADVQNRVIHTGRKYSELALQQAAREINQRFSGHSLDELRKSLVSAMATDKSDIDQYMQATLDLANRTFEAEPSADNDYVLAGEKSLLSATSPDRLDKLHGLFEAFEQKRDILDLVDRCLTADGVQIFIGEESGYEVFGDYSVVTSSYQVKGESVGVLGVIGPTRMAYDRVIPVVDITSKMLSIALDRK